MASYLEKYPNCDGCPVYKHCGNSVSSRLLCNSYVDDDNNNNTKNKSKNGHKQQKRSDGSH